ncbi:PREDICTED: nucleosome-remodeling factor subunit BPTF-like, partial [Rhagoletis zephyria]|uniref:nucleosome-remodeling factor subunit BPTF-like n=1 Tax=Rhagoletis zephyria TaxID=28612 RepID=UPI000811656B
MRKIIVPIDLPSTPSCEVSTPIRSGLRQRKRPVSPPVKGPRMEEIWLNEEELELWEIRQFAERAIMEERKRQAELRQKAAAELRKSNASTPISANRAQLVNGARNSTTTPTTTPTTNSPLNINTKQAISSRLSSIFQNRAANRVLASASPVVNSGTITPTTATTTYATIRTANGTFRVPVHNKPGAPPNQLFLRTGGQIITSSSTAAAQQGSTSVIQGGNVIVTSNAVSGSGGITPTRPGTYIVRVPANAGAGGGLGTAKPLIISNVGSWSNGALPDIVRGGNPNIKQAVPLIEPKGPQKISTGTTVNAIQATSSSSSSAAKSTTPAQSTAAVTTTTGAINIVTPLSTTPTIGKGIQCVQLKTSDGRTHLLPISSLPTAPGQTFQIALNSGGSGTPLRLITTSTAVNNKPVDNGKGQTTYMISAGSSAFVPGANGGQKVILQQQQSANSITSTNSTTVTPATDSSFKVMVEPTTAGSSAKTNLVTAPATTATTTALITSSSSKPAAPAPAEPPKVFELTATYCICQQAYDSNKFYICCDCCQ